MFDPTFRIDWNRPRDCANRAAGRDALTEYERDDRRETMTTYTTEQRHEIAETVGELHAAYQAGEVYEPSSSETWENAALAWLARWAEQSGHEVTDLDREAARRFGAEMEVGQ